MIIHTLLISICKATFLKCVQASVIFRAKAVLSVVISPLSRPRLNYDCATVIVTNLLNKHRLGCQLQLVAPSCCVREGRSVTIVALNAYRGNSATSLIPRMFSWLEVWNHMGREGGTSGFILLHV